jgi:hypothetical protein
VQFTRFEFTPHQVSKFSGPDIPVVLRIGHPAYDHIALMPEQTRRLLCHDLKVLGTSSGIASRIAADPRNATD